MDSKIPLSVAIVTINEADKLPGCLKSVAFAEQIVVVDSHSSDSTVQIASDFGCEVFIEDWRGFGLQKQSAVDHCTHRWVLILDADERIPPENALKIMDIVLNSSTAVAGYSFPRKNFFQGRWIRHGGWRRDRVTRLFQRDLGRMTPAIVHEAVEVNGTVVALDVPIEHFTESRLSSILHKIDRYSTLGAVEASEGGRKTTVWSAALRAFLTFFQGYFLRLGILDGAQGLTLAIADAVNKFFKYAKLNEINRRGKPSNHDKQ
ncbi:MAG: glycosyltransferase family 2 protein [Syntrophales bacterium]|nr:glycosyltransferase family 2 protein [Syntrophales bacterium]